MKLTVIIPVTEHASDTEKANGPLLRKLLHPDTQLEFVSIERGFPAIESDLHAVFNGADSLVCGGAGRLCLAMVLDIIKESKNRGNEKRKSETKE